MKDKHDRAGSGKEDAPTFAPFRRAWNWFGTLFGAVVLIGGGILYLGADGGSGDDIRPAAAVEEADAHDDEGEAHEDEDPHADDEDAHADADAEGMEAMDEEAKETSNKEASGSGGGRKGKVIEIEMIEFGYLPQTIDVVAGKRVVLRFTNTGKVVHEAMIGDTHMQEEFATAGDHGDGHDADGGGHHGDVMAVTVQPGETKDLKVMIDEPGEWLIGCHLTGHWDAGMVSRINVT